jgi:hypothetical protein
MTAWAYDMNVEPRREPSARTQSPTLASPAPTALGERRLGWFVWLGHLGQCHPERRRPRQAGRARGEGALGRDGRPSSRIALRPKLAALRGGQGARARDRGGLEPLDGGRALLARIAARWPRSCVRWTGATSSSSWRATRPARRWARRARSAMPAPSAPSAEAAQEVERFLGSVEPDGGTNLLTAVQAARSAARSVASGRELRVLYLGDGTPTVGPVARRDDRGGRAPRAAGGGGQRRRGRARLRRRHDDAVRARAGRQRRGRALRSGPAARARRRSTCSRRPTARC